MPAKHSSSGTDHVGKRHTVTRRRVLHAVPGAVVAISLPARVRSTESTKIVKIGHTQSLSGPSAPYGIRARDGAILAMNEINRAGGFTDKNNNKYVIEILESDMVNDPKQAVTLFRQHALDPAVVASMGPTNSLGFLPCIPAAAQFELPLIGNGSGAPVKKWTPWAYRVNPEASTATPIFLEAVVNALGVRRLAVIYDQTQDGQAADAKIVKNLAEQMGYEVIAYEAFRSSDQDFSPQLTKIRARKPNAVFVAAATGDGVRIVTQLREFGIDTPLLTGYGAFFDPVYWDATNGKIKDCYTWLAQDPNHAAGSLKTWLEEYNSQYRLEATSFSMYGYDAVFTIMECIKQTNGTDRGNIQKALSSLNFTSPIGSHIRFRNPPHGNNLNPSITILKIDGRASGQSLS
jgi:branched-chain amino acid transport system substrate-binding protein